MSKLIIHRVAQQRPCVISEKSIIILVRARRVIIDSYRISRSQLDCSNCKSLPRKDVDYSHIISDNTTWTQQCDYKRIIFLSLKNLSVLHR